MIETLNNQILDNGNFGFPKFQIIETLDNINFR